MIMSLGAGHQGFTVWHCTNSKSYLQAILTIKTIYLWDNSLEKMPKIVLFILEKFQITAQCSALMLIVLFFLSSLNSWTNQSVSLFTFDTEYGYTGLRHIRLLQCSIVSSASLAFQHIEIFDQLVNRWPRAGHFRYF